MVGVRVMVGWGRVRWSDGGGGFDDCNDVGVGVRVMVGMGLMVKVGVRVKVHGMDLQLQPLCSLIIYTEYLCVLSPVQYPCLLCLCQLLHSTGPQSSWSGSTTGTYPDLVRWWSSAKMEVLWYVTAVSVL